MASSFSCRAVLPHEDRRHAMGFRDIAQGNSGGHAGSFDLDHSVFMRASKSERLIGSRHRVSRALSGTDQDIGSRPNTSSAMVRSSSARMPHASDAAPERSNVSV